MEILSMSTCAEKLGTTVRTLRHYLTKDHIVPYRQLELGGNTHVRYFTAEDFTTIQEWWVRSHAQRHASKGEFHSGNEPPLVRRKTCPASMAKQRGSSLGRIAHRQASKPQGAVTH